MCIEDQFGNVVTTDSSTITVALATGSGPLQGILTATAISGVATFTNLADNNAENITLYFSDRSVTGVTDTTTITVGAVALDDFAISTISSPKTAGTAFSITTITAQDVYNNTVTSFTGTVDLTETGGGAGGTITPSQSGTFTAGVLSNASVTLSKAGIGSNNHGY